MELTDVLPRGNKILAKKYNIEIIETKDQSYSKEEEDEKESISILLDFELIILTQKFQ